MHAPGVSGRAATAWVLASLAAVASAQEPAGPLEGERVRVSFDVVATPSGGATAPLGSVSGSLRVGETLGPLLLSPFGPSSALPADCGGVRVLARGSPAGPLESQAAAWSVEAKVLAASTGSVSLDVKWRRFVAGRGGRAVEAAGEARPAVALAEGSRVLLDFLDRPAFSVPRCALNVALELHADLDEDPALARSRIAFDLWLVHDTPTKRSESVPLQVTSRQGEDASFRFPAQGVGEAGAGKAPGLTLEVKGGLRGRVRRDGSVEIAVSVERTVWLARGEGTLGGRGHKVVRVRPGEAVRFALPASGDPTVGPLAGHRLSLVLRARPAP